MPLEVVEECREWVGHADSQERECVSFQLLIKLLAVVEGWCNHINMFEAIEENSKMIGSLSMNDDSVSECASIASVDTMIVHDEGERLGPGDDGVAMLERTAATVQKLWRIARLQVHIQDRRALLESSSSQTVQVRSESSLDAGEVMQLAEFLNKNPSDSENLIPNLLSSYTASSKPVVSSGRIVKKILHCWSHGMLDRRAFGEWLSGSSDLNRATLETYLGDFDFAGLFIVNALRIFLENFDLPGEAQRIDRVMDAFAQRYHAQNPNTFSHPDIVYILAFSVILLNTDAHNFNVKSKMTLAQFIKNNSSVFSNPDSSINVKLLEDIYRSVLKREIISRPAGRDKLLKFVECTALNAQIDMRPEVFAQIMSEQKYLGAFHCNQGNSSESWPSALFRKERIALVTEEFFVLLKSTSRSSKKYECKALKSMKHIRGIQQSANPLNIEIRFSDGVPGSGLSNSKLKCGIVGCVSLTFKTDQYAKAFAELISEAIQEYVVNQQSIRQQKMKISKQKAQQAKSIIESIYRASETIEIQ